VFLAPRGFFLITGMAKKKKKGTTRVNTSALPQLHIIFALILKTFPITGAQDSVHITQYNPTTFIADAHVHIGLTNNKSNLNITDLEYFSDRDIDAFIYALPVDRSKTSDFLSRITHKIEQIKHAAEKSNNLSLTLSTGQIEQNTANNRISLMLGIEYFYGVFGNSLNTVQAYKQLGIRYITLMGDSEEGLFSESGGLNEFGKKVVEKMNEVGILIDISHLSEDQMLKVIRYSKAPVIASHSGALGVATVNGNLPDAVLRALKGNHGYVMITFNKKDLYGEENLSNDGVYQLIDHIDYLKEIIGIDHIGIGSDYQANGRYVPAELNEIDVFRKIVNTMTLRGYTISEINGILGRNILKVLNFEENM
jgi:membrane dipeptidase